VGGGTLREVGCGPEALPLGLHTNLPGRVSEHCQEKLGGRGWVLGKLHPADERASCHHVQGAPNAGSGAHWR